MNRPDRQSILCIGIPGSGKTALTLRISDAMIAHPGFESVFVLDTREQFSTPLNRYVGDLEAQLEALEEDDARFEQVRRVHGLRAGQAVRKLDGPLVRNLGEFAEFCGMLAAERKSTTPTVIPRRVIWRCGPNAVSYGEAIGEAVNIGNVVLLPCESRLWWPNHRYQWPINEIPARPDVTMEHLVTMGRAHLKNRRGEYCALHLVLDAQDFGMMYQLIRKDMETVLCSRLEGGESYAIIRREFGDGTATLSNRVRKLEDHQWIAVRGKMPELAPFRGGGR